MNINRISSLKVNEIKNSQKNNQNNYAQNPFYNNQLSADTVSFTGNGSKGFLNRAKITILAIFTAITTLFTGCQNDANATEASDSADTGIPKTGIVADYPEYVPTVEELLENNSFQLRQTKDAPSVTCCKN